MAGLVGPAGMSPEVTEQLTTALGEVLQEPEYVKFMQDRGYAMQWTTGTDFEAFMKSSDAALSETLKAVGLSK